MDDRYKELEQQHEQDIRDAAQVVGEYAEDLAKAERVVEAARKVDAEHRWDCITYPKPGQQTVTAESCKCGLTALDQALVDHDRALETAADAEEAFVERAKLMVVAGSNETDAETDAETNR